MRKIVYVLGACVLALSACDGKDANAQMQQSMDVGTPDSANMLMMEESYTITAPANKSTQPTNQMEPLPGDPGVEVAPVPENQNQQNGDNNSGSNGSGDMEEVIEETISTTTQGM